MWQLEDYQDTSWNEHRAILDAVIPKNRRLAKRLTKAHITSAGEVMLEAQRMQRP